MLWDEQYQVWNHYDVRSQPTAVLVDATGQVLHTFEDLFDPADVLSRLGA